MSNFQKINNVIPIVASTAALVRAFNLQNVRVPDARSNSYEQNKLNAKAPDAQKNKYEESKLNVKVTDARSNQYEQNKLSQNYVAPDAPLTSNITYNENILGTPIFADLTLVGGSYTDNITNELVYFDTIKFATVLLTVNFTARIIKTEIQGRNGTVKEYIGEDDAKVQIQGIISGPNGHYPEYEVSKLNDWRKAPISKSVTSTYLQNLGIYNLVVESFDMPQIAGGYSYQTFNISCISDTPVELKIV